MDEVRELLEKLEKFKFMPVQIQSFFLLTGPRIPHSSARLP